MGFSRASKDLLMKAEKVATKGVLKVGKAGVKLHDKVMTKLEESSRLTNQAVSIMDKKYPGGWSQSATNMTELNDIRRGLKKK